MTKHYVLSLDPAAEYDWDRCILRDPITAERPELAQLVAEAVGKQSGYYLVSVNIEVTVLEKAANPQPKPFSAALVARVQPEELVA
jgi:hypothetical protein